MSSGGSSVRKRSGRGTLAQFYQRMAGHRLGLRDIEQTQQGRCDIASCPLLMPPTFAGGLTRISGTGLVVCAVCGSPVVGSRIISALP